MKEEMGGGLLFDLGWEVGIKAPNLQGVMGSDLKNWVYGPDRHVLFLSVYVPAGRERLVDRAVASITGRLIFPSLLLMRVKITDYAYMGRTRYSLSCKSTLSVRDSYLASRSCVLGSTEAYGCILTIYTLDL